MFHNQTETQPHKKTKKHQTKTTLNQQKHKIKQDHYNKTKHTT